MMLTCTQNNSIQSQNSTESKERSSSSKIQNGNIERQTHYPAEDIRLKDKPQQHLLSSPPVSQVSLVSNAYQDDDDDDGLLEPGNNYFN